MQQMLAEGAEKRKRSRLLHYNQRLPEATIDRSEKRNTPFYITHRCHAHACYTNLAFNLFSIFQQNILFRTLVLLLESARRILPSQESGSRTVLCDIGKCSHCALSSKGRRMTPMEMKRQVERRSREVEVRGRGGQGGRHAGRE